MDKHSPDKNISSSKSLRRFLKNVLGEVFLICIAAILVSIFYCNNYLEHLLHFWLQISIYWLILFIVSLFFKKYEYRVKFGFVKAVKKYFITWLLATSFFFIILYLFHINAFYHKWILIGISCLILEEFVMLIVQYSFRYSTDVDKLRELAHLETIRKGIHADEKTAQAKDEDFSDIWLESINSEEIIDLIQKNTIKKNARRLILFTYSRFNLLIYKDKSFDQIINLSKINRIRYINKFHESVYIKLRTNGYYLVCVETLEQRNIRLNNKFPPVINYIFRLYDFCFHRVFPRLPYLRKIYFRIWNHWNKPLSYAESLGRLYSCGFELVEEKEINNKWYFVLCKKNMPALNYEVTYGPIIHLHRTGKGGKPIKVYKFRTMHPYSEFLQELVMKRNNLAAGGKFKNDFRVSIWGHFLRKTWIDELPMIVNLIKGDLKLVGIRPLSKHYLSLYPEEFQKKRSTVKPGLIPPFYADMPKTLPEIIASEEKYIDAYKKHKFLTDCKYFRKSFCNIVFRHARSN